MNKSGAEQHMDHVRAEANFLKAWAHEEIHDPRGPAHQLQEAHGADATELAARFRAWAREERLDPISITRMLDQQVDGPITWPWSTAVQRKEASNPITPLEQFTADHRYLLRVVAREAGFADPVAIDADQFHWSLIARARRKALFPIDGVLIRSWSPITRRSTPGIQLGMRLYEIEDIRFVVVNFPFTNQYHHWGIHFIAVDRKDYRRLYRLAVQSSRISPSGRIPVLPQEQLEILWKNTIGYLERANLRRIQAFGGRAKRGVLLTGSPGNGKTMACRWLWEQCRQRRWEWRLITPDDYRKARSIQAVDQLFSVQRRGILFFDDMDLALRDRETVSETEDQAIFLTALDGISTKEGVVFVFTTNCPLELIDRAFKRPGRIDVTLDFRSPGPDLRRRLIEGWHSEIRDSLNLEDAAASTDGYSFAEIEEVKNLLIMHFMDSGMWDWSWAQRQFATNRGALINHQSRHAGFQ